MKKTLSFIFSIVMAITCVTAIPATAFANTMKNASTIKVGESIACEITEESDSKSAEEFYVKFVPETSGYYEFYTKNDSKVGEDAIVMCAIMDSKENLVGGMGAISGDPLVAEILGVSSLKSAAELKAGKTYYFSIAGMDYGTFSTTVYLKSGHNHSYQGYEYPAYCDSEFPEFSEDGAKGKTCVVCGDEQTSATYYYPKTLTLSATECTYNGKEKKPKVTVKDRKGNVISSKNYKVKYSNNKKVGTATVKVTFNNKKYSGELVKTFKINPSAVSISSVSPLSKGFKVTWKKKDSAQATGYEIRYSTSAKMTGAKTVTVKGYSKASKEIKKLKGNKKYHVQVRAYKTVSGKKYYSDWSKSLSVKTKK